VDITLLIIVVIGVLVGIAMVRMFPGKRAWLMPFALVGIMAAARIGKMYPDPIVGTINLNVLVILGLFLVTLIMLVLPHRAEQPKDVQTSQ